MKTLGNHSHNRAESWEETGISIAVEEAMHGFNTAGEMRGTAAESTKGLGRLVIR